MQIEKYISMMMQAIDNSFIWFEKFITGETWVLIVSTLAFGLIVRFIIMPLVRNPPNSGSDSARKRDK